jgi:hypothetical protein
MSATKTLAILIVTGAFTMLFGTLHPQHALAGGKSIVGSWVVQVFPNPLVRPRLKISSRVPAMAATSTQILVLEGVMVSGKKWDKGRMP